MPHYGPRRDPNSPARMISSDPEETVRGLTQAVKDIRYATAWLGAQEEIDANQLGIMGISLGGITAALAGSAEPRLHKICPILAGGGIGTIAWDTKESHFVAARQRWEAGGGTRDTFLSLMSKVDPAAYGDYARRKTILMLNARHDEVIPRAATDALGPRSANRRSSGSTPGTTRRSGTSPTRCAASPISSSRRAEGSSSERTEQVPSEVQWSQQMLRVTGYSTLCVGFFALTLAVHLHLIRAADKPAGATHEAVAADKQALAPFQSYVGEWKGVGLPRRGSSQGSWTEEAQWAWHFTDKHAELTADITAGHFYSALRLQAGDRTGQFKLIATVTAGSAAAGDASATNDKTAAGKGEERFEGAADDGKLVLTAVGEAKPDRPARVTIRVVADGDRLVVLYERRVGEQFARLAEVGYTRKGSSFAVKGGDPHECIVTGGHGTIAVEYKGNTYYFCCTGCRDLFKQDPEGVLAEYRQRKAQSRKSKPRVDRVSGCGFDSIARLRRDAVPVPAKSCHRRPREPLRPPLLPAS